MKTLFDNTPAMKTERRHASVETAPLRRVRCRDCRHASAFIENSCHCARQNRRTCACHRYGRVCQEFESRNNVQKSKP